MRFSKVSKIYVGWATIIAVGIAGFAMARQSVVGNRAEIMRRKQSIRDFVIAEREAEDN